MEAKINAARLKERITFQRPVMPTTPAGQLPGGIRRQGWEDVCTVWAEVKSVKNTTADSGGFVGSGFSKGSGATQFENVYKFYIRWREGIRADMRIVWRGRIFIPKGEPLDWVSYHVGMTIEAEELVNYAKDENGKAR